jgi:hypothetical protein
MAYYDRKTGEEIRPFGYELDPQGRPVHRRLPNTGSRSEPTICCCCDKPLNAAGDCEDCASKRQGEV